MNCMLASLAKILDEPPESLIKDLGHDGTTFEWPELQMESPSFGRRGFHFQEFIDVCMLRRKILVPIELDPIQAPNVRSFPVHAIPTNIRVKRFLTYLSMGKALLIDAKHCCAWDGIRVYDPATNQYKDLEPEEYEMALILLDL